MGTTLFFLVFVFLLALPYFFYQKINWQLDDTKVSIQTLKGEKLQINIAEIQELRKISFWSNPYGFVLPIENIKQHLFRDSSVFWSGVYIQTDVPYVIYLNDPEDFYWQVQEMQKKTMLNAKDRAEG